MKYQMAGVIFDAKKTVESAKGIINEMEKALKN